MAKLVLTGLTKHYGDVVAVDHIDLALKEGEFVSLLGPSGCGKTTTLRMIAGFIDPTDGVVEMNGQALSTPAGTVPPERRGMSMIFQSYAIWPNMTVYENVAFGLKVRKLPGADVKRRVAEILDIVQLAALAQRYPNELSGGQQQRVALARAIVVKPEVLLLDEPLSNLDANLREEMRREIRRLHNEFRITTVYVTHDQAEAMAISDRIAVMNKGRIEQLDEPFAVYSKPRTRFVAGFIGRTNFIEGRRQGAAINFKGFDIPATAVAGTRDQATATFSVRPQSLVLHRARPSQSSGLLVQGKIIERTFLGETWDYVFGVDEGERLRVVAPPANVVNEHEPVWLEIDPAQIVRVEEDKARS
jgi:ABC-type Fe3+/spermidine/putrescine transport system ATPase subunit